MTVVVLMIVSLLQVILPALGLSIRSDPIITARCAHTQHYASHFLLMYMG